MGKDSLSFPIQQEKKMDIPSLNLFLLEIKDGIALLTRNDEPRRNPLNAEAFGEILTFMNFAERNKDIRAVIITGAGEKAFASGADIKELLTRTPAQHLMTPQRAALLSIENSSKAVIAAVNGFALGGGFELSLACDLCVCAEHAKFGLPETGLGIMPGGGGTQRLARIVGLRKAKEMILTGRIINAEEAERLGIVMSVVPKDQLIDKAREIAGTIASKAPIATAIAKRSVNNSLYTDISTGVNNESVYTAMLLGTEDAREGFRAFLEKRPPEFKGQ